MCNGGCYSFLIIYGSCVTLSFSKNVYAIKILKIETLSLRTLFIYIVLIVTKTSTEQCYFLRNVQWPRAFNKKQIMYFVLQINETIHYNQDVTFTS